MIERLKQLKERGFTLLEVLVAFAILATLLVANLGTVSVSNQQAIYANTLTRVTQLTRAKMIDLEYELVDEGFQDDLQTFSGDFRDEGFEDVTWEAAVHPVEIPPDVKEELVGQVNAQLFGGADSQGALKGNAAFSSALPLLVSQVPEMINQIGKKIRRVTLVVSYDYMGSEETMTVTQYVVDRDSAQFNLFGMGATDGSDTGEN